MNTIKTKHKLMKIRHSIFVLSLFAVLTFMSCQKKAGSEDYKPPTIGKSSELSIVISDAYWEDSLGQVLRKIFKQPVPYLPQDEPMFDVSQFPPAIFKDAFLKTRNVLVVQIDPKYADPSIDVLVVPIDQDSTGPSIATANDVYARPQSIAYLRADSPTAAASYISNAENVVLRYFLERNRNAQILTNKNFKDLKLQNVVSEKFDVNIILTPGYREAVLPEGDDDFMWLDFNGSIARMGILIYTNPYLDQEMFSKEAIIERRNEMLKKYVQGDKDSSYMTTEIELLPSVKSINFRGSYAVEMRGLWKMQNDFLGGPFISLTVLDEKNNRLVTVEGFVSAQATEKRDYMRQVEAIVYSLSFIEDAAIEQ